MIGNFEMGCLNMIGIESYFTSLRASWVSRLVSGGMDYWKLIPYKYFRQFGKNWLIFPMNIDYKKFNDYLRHIPELYKEIVKTWIKMGRGSNKNAITFSRDHKTAYMGKYMYNV